MYQKYRHFIIPLSMMFIMFMGLMLFMSKFKINPDMQEYRCLDSWLYLVDVKDLTVEKGDIIAFVHEKGAKKIPAGTRLQKILRGVPGDEIVVRQNYTMVNSVKYDIPMDFGLKVLGDDIEQYERDFVVPEGHFFVMGTTHFSNDSRFWGTIPQTSVVGTAYAIL